MRMRYAGAMVAVPHVLSGVGDRYGVVHAFEGVRSPRAAHTLFAGDATARPATPALARIGRKHRAAAPKTPAAPPVKPIGGHTTIAPFPVPGDTSRGAAERMKTLNVPKPGVTTIAPLPPPTSLPLPAPGTPTPTPAPDQDPPRLGPDGKPLPALGEYVYVEVLPEAIVRVPPTYPPDAREAGIQGTVEVQALVLRDGTVADVRIVKSIPPLDSAAAAAVRQWRFKPAMASGQPVAAWVEVPVRFTLH